ncbi:MAG: DUF4349 domain-containing protein [Bacteroidia bacterium]
MKIPSTNALSFMKAMRLKSFRTFRSLLLILTLTAMVCSCSSADERFRSEEKAALADSVSSLISSTASKISAADSNHTFIRTADIKFKVKNVKLATFTIEDLVNKHKGFVTYTNLSGTVSYKNRTKLSEDSLLEATHYQVDNSLTIRVPNTQLDSVLREIAPLMEFLDHRTIKADDIKFTLLSNQLAEKRFVQHKQRYTNAIDTKGKKLRETAGAENDLLSKQESADNTRVETLELLDQVNYSTVTLYIYQPETISYTRLPDENTIVPYTPSFAKQLGTAFLKGWEIFENLLLFFVEIWGVIVIAIGLYFIIRKTVTYLSRPIAKKA